LYSLTDTDTDRKSGWASHAIAKLAEGATITDAERELETIARRLEGAWPEDYPEGYGLTLQPLGAALTGSSATTFILLLGLAFLVLLIACANVANLNLARLADRAQELSIREAVGANPGRVARQLFTESLLYALAGAVIGLVIAYPCLDLLAAFAADYTPLGGAISMNPAMLLFSFAVTVLAALVSGSASAFQRRDINRILKEGSGKATSAAAGLRRRRALMIAQYALAFVSLTIGLLIVLRLARLQDQETGYDMESILAASLVRDYDFAAQRPSVEGHMRTFARTLLDRAAAMPAVEGAAIMAGTPLLQNVDYL